MTEIYWGQTPLRQESNRIAIFMQPYYGIALKKNVTQHILDEMRIRAINRQNLIMFWLGIQGSGKSYSMLFLITKYLEYLHGQKLGMKNVFYRLSDLFTAIRDAKEESIFCMDEQVYTAGLGSNIERMALSNIEQVVRVKKLSFFYSSPREVAHVYHYKVETWEIGFTEPWDMEKVVGEPGYLERMWKYTKNVVFDSKDSMLGYFITAAPQDKKFLADYEKHKREFVDTVQIMGGGGRQDIYMAMAKDLLNRDSFMKKYALSKTKRLRELLIRIELRGILFGVQEMKTLVDYMEFLCSYEQEFIERYAQFVPTRR